MRITILGSGTLLSGRRRKPNAVLLESGLDKAVLDMGPGILSQIHVLEINPLELNTIFLTHFHLDHCADVFPLLMTRYLLDPQANKNICLCGPADIAEWFNTIASTQGNWLHDCLPEVRVMSADSDAWGGYGIRTSSTKHTDNSIAYRFTLDKSYFFSGDTGFDEKLIHFAAGCDIAFVECSFPDEESKPQHMTPSELGLFAQRAEIKKLIVSHMYPSNDTPDLKEKIAVHFNGEIVIAEDLLIIE